MKIDHISASRIKTFEQCEMRYHAIYDLGVPEGEPHPAATMGKAVHLALERGIQASCAGQNFDLVELTGQACGELKVSTDLEGLAKELVGNAVEWGVLRRAKYTVGCEIKFEVKLENGVPLVGYIDRLDDMSDSGMDIIDYKTQKEVFDEKKLAMDWQARVYNLAVRSIYPEAKNVRVSFWVLRHRVQRVIMTAADAERDRKELVKVVEEIRACENPVARPSPLCQWCPHAPNCDASKMGVRERMRSKHG